MLDYDTWYHNAGADEYEEYLNDFQNLHPNDEPEEEWAWLETRYTEFISECNDRAYEAYRDEQLKSTEG
jgi:uncharacterized short protein YbdD (DUF466 family)